MFGDHKEPWIWGWTRKYSDAWKRLRWKQIKGTILIPVWVVFSSNYDILTSMLWFRPKTTTGLGVKRHGVQFPC